MSVGCIGCEHVNEQLRDAIRVQERRRARSVPLDMRRVEQIKALRATHRRIHEASDAA